MSNYRDELGAAHERAARAEERVRELEHAEERARAAEAEVTRLEKILGVTPPAPSGSRSAKVAVGVLGLLLAVGGLFVVAARQAQSEQERARLALMAAEQTARAEARKAEELAKAREAEARLLAAVAAAKDEEARARLEAMLSEARPAGARSAPREAAELAATEIEAGLSTCATGPSESGRAFVRFDGSGTVTSVEVVGHLAGSATAACVRQRYLRATVPRFAGPSITLARTFTLGGR